MEKGQCSNEMMVKIVVGELAIRGASAGTIRFVRDVYKLLAQSEGVSCAKMSEESGIARQWARKHIAWLENNGYIERLNYRSWKIQKNPVKDPEYNVLLTLAQQRGYIPKAL